MKMVRFYCLLQALCLCAGVNEPTDFYVIHSFITSLQIPYLSKQEASEIAQCCVAYGKQNKIDPLLIASLIYRESTFNPRAVSSTGALGLQAD